METPKQNALSSEKVIKHGKIVSDPVIETKNDKERMKFNLNIKGKELDQTIAVQAPVDQKLKRGDYVAVSGFEKKGSNDINAFQVERTLKLSGTIKGDIQSTEIKAGPRKEFTLEKDDKTTVKILAKESLTQGFKSGDQVQVKGYDKGGYLAVENIKPRENSVEKSIAREGNTATKTNAEKIGKEQRPDQAINSGASESKKKMVSNSELPQVKSKNENASKKPKLKV